MPAVLDDTYAAFIGEHLDDIESRFTTGRWKETQEDLRKLKSKRAREMFG